jgi:hypothetical protein
MLHARDEWKMSQVTQFTNMLQAEWEMNHVAPSTNVLQAEWEMSQVAVSIPPCYMIDE